MTGLVRESSYFHFEKRNLNPIPQIVEKLKTLDFFTTAENLEFGEALLAFFRQSYDFEIGPSYYQLFGIVMSGENYSLCKKAQILALNGYTGKADAIKIRDMNPTLDLQNLQKSPRNLFLLRSIRWYLTTAYPLLEWKSKEELDFLRKVENIGHECFNFAIEVDAYWEIIQFYLAIMPFSHDPDLRERIDSLKGHLPPESKSIVNEQLFNLDTLKIIDEVETIDPSLSQIDSHIERKNKIEDRIIRVNTLIEKIKGRETVCYVFKEDLRVKIMASIVRLYSHAHILGVKVDLISIVKSLYSTTVVAMNPTGIHLDALRSVRKAYVIINDQERIADCNERIDALIKRVRP